MEKSIENPITAHLIADNYRPNFLAGYLGLLCMDGESLVYRWMGKLSPDYKGGYWAFYGLSNGGFYMAPTQPRQLEITVEGNGFDGTVSADAAGVIACLFALNTLACNGGGQAVIDRYYELRDFALGHPERVSILRAID